MDYRTDETRGGILRAWDTKAFRKVALAHDIEAIMRARPAELPNRLLVSAETLAATYTRFAREHIRPTFARLHVAGWRAVPGNVPEPPDPYALAKSRMVPTHDQDHNHQHWTDGDNYMFRFVHDAVGHCGALLLLTGAVNDFTLSGEIAAFRQQARFVTTNELFVRVLFGEIVGQAAYFDVFGRFPVRPDGRQPSLLLDPNAYRLEA
jgi:hypothetical protein